MKQQVNFYGEQFKPKKELFSLQNMLLVWIAGIVLVLALYNFESERAAMAEKSFQMSQQHVNLIIYVILRILFYSKS